MCGVSSVICGVYDTVSILQWSHQTAHCTPVLLRGVTTVRSHSVIAVMSDTKSEAIVRKTPRERNMVRKVPLL